MEPHVRYRLFVIGVLTVLLCFEVASLHQRDGIKNVSLQALLHTADKPVLIVSFLDVGQGDAMYIKTPDGVDVLIDGGPDSSVLRELGEEMSLFDRALDLVVATHEDADHIGGLLDVVDRFSIAHLLISNNESDTPLAKEWRHKVAEGELSIIHPAPGMVVALGSDVTLTVFSPPSQHEQLETNTASIVARLSYGEIDFMLTGDAPYGIETYLVDTYGTLLESEVLKLGHHGSKTSSHEVFLEAVDPEYAVVSAGKDNRYGHPHAEVVERVEASGAVIRSTAVEGTIRFKSDGKKVWVEE